MFGAPSARVRQLFGAAAAPFLELQTSVGQVPRGACAFVRLVTSRVGWYTGWAIQAVASCRLHWDPGAMSTPELQCRRPRRVYVPEVSDLGLLFVVSCFACAFARWAWFVFFARRYRFGYKNAGISRNCQIQRNQVLSRKDLKLRDVKEGCVEEKVRSEPSFDVRLRSPRVRACCRVLRFGAVVCRLYVRVWSRRWSVKTLRMCARVQCKLMCAADAKGKENRNQWLSKRPVTHLCT